MNKAGDGSSPFHLLENVAEILPALRSLAARATKSRGLAFLISEGGGVFKTVPPFFWWFHESGVTKRPGNTKQPCWMMCSVGCISHISGLPSIEPGSGIKRSEDSNSRERRT